MSVLGIIAGGAVQAGLGALNNVWAEKQQSEARRENYMYGEMAANEADRRTRALYSDFYSPQALMKQYKEAGLSPSMMFGGTPGQGGVSGAQGSGAAGLPTPYMPISMLEGAQIGLMKAQQENIEADTKKKNAETGNVLTDTEVKQLQKDYQHWMNKIAEKNGWDAEAEMLMNIGVIKTPEDKYKSLFEIAQNANTYEDYLKAVRNAIENGDSINKGRQLQATSTVKGQEVLKSTYKAAKEFKTDIDVLKSTSVSANFQKSVVEELSKIDYAKTNAEAIQKQLRANIATTELTESQKNAWNNLINRLGKDEWYTDVIIAMAMIFGNYAQGANIKLNTGENYITVNKSE